MKKAIALFALLCMAIAASAQTITVSGKVTDQNGEPLPGAGVLIQGTTHGTTTDLDGNYSISCGKDQSLEFSFIGYSTQTIAVGGRTKVDAKLANDANILDDVVVVGYGVQNKRDVTTSIVSIKAEDFLNKPGTDFREAMAAKMPGVQVIQLGGQPDGNVSIRVRGIQSATSGNDPLYVIDGVPCDSRAFANLDARTSRASKSSRTHPQQPSTEAAVPAVSSSSPRRREAARPLP